MGAIIVTKRFDSSPDAVFRTLTDLEHAAEHVSGIKKLELLTDGPVGLGTRFRETRMMFKKEATEEMEITAFDPGRSYTVECESCGCHYSTEIRCEPQGAGTEVTMDMHYRPLTFMAKMMTPLGILMSGSLKKLFEKDLEDLKRHSEMATV